MAVFVWWVQLEWKKGKVNPIVSTIKARLRLKPMPLNMVHDADGLPRIILTEPAGSSAEVIYAFLFGYSFEFLLINL